MVEYSGHPILDVGIATLVAFAGKERPEELTEVDLEGAADYMAANYVVNPLKNFLTVAFPLSGYTQPAYEKTPEKRVVYGERVLRAFRASTPTLDEVDVFLGRPVAAVRFDVKGELSPGRAFRQHIPLQTGEDMINFQPYGEAGIAVSGLTLLAFQAYPLGSAKCGGRTLSVHSDNPEIMGYFAEKFLAENRKAIQLAQQNNEAKMAEPHLKHRTLLIQTLLEATQQQLRSKRRQESFSITAYHMTNIGQGADLTIFYLPSQVVGYLQEMLGADYQVEWDRLVGLGWERPKLKRGEEVVGFRPGRNYLYEDLYRLAEDVVKEAGRFIRTYFLRQTLRLAKSDPADPRTDYSTVKEAYLVSWKVTEPFLRRILAMDEGRIEQIRALGDGLAAYVSGQNERRFFRNFYTENRYGYFRAELMKANLGAVRQGHSPLLTLASYLTVFEEGSDVARPDWLLARDLVLIRMVEQLHGNGWFGKNGDVLAEPEE